MTRRTALTLIEAVSVVAVCSIFGFLVISFARSTSATFDETTHLPAGYSYLRWHDYRMNPEHPPFVKKLAALPLLLLRVWPANIELREAGRLRDTQNHPGITSDTENVIDRAWAAAVDQIDQQWVFGHSFLYGVRKETLERLNEQDPSVKDQFTIPTTERLNKKDFYNDADDLLFRGRMVVMLLGILLAVLLYLWSRALFGIAGGMLSSLLFCFDPNTIAHSGLVTTDIGVTLFMFGAVYFLWRVCNRLKFMTVILFLLLFGLAFVTKFSAILLIPMFWFAVTARMISGEEWLVAGDGKIKIDNLLRKATVSLVLFVAAMLSALLMIWASYDFRYCAAKNPEAAGEALVLPAGKSSTAASTQEGTASSSSPGEAGHFPIEEVLHSSAALESELKFWHNSVAAEKWTEFELQVKRATEKNPLTWKGHLVMFAKEHSLLPEAYLYGFAYGEMKSLLRASYLRGEYSNVGFRDYFLWTFLLKTPLPALLAIAASIVIAFARRQVGTSWLPFIVAPISIYLLVSIFTNLNIGYRHLLPIYPFLYLFCGGLSVEWMRLRPSARWVSAAIAIFAIMVSCEFVFYPLWQPAKIHPHYLAYFNELGGGPRNGYKSLVDSNLDWGQELKELQAWFDTRKIEEPIWLSYFGMADPRFYRIRHINVPKILGGYPLESSPYDFLESEGRYTDAIEKFTSDLRPGQYIAISATNASAVYLGKQAHDLWQQIFDRSTYIDQIGYSIFIYRLKTK